jgi:hypothetical protein
MAKSDDIIRGGLNENIPGIARATKLCQKAILEVNVARAGLALAEAQKARLDSRLTQALKDYRVLVDSEISVAPACKCDCEKS